MKYLKFYEGFTTQQIDKMIKNGETSVYKLTRSNNNKVNKFSNDLINYDISGFTFTEKNNYYMIYPDYNFIKLYNNYCKINNFKPKELVFTLSILPEPIVPEFGYNQIDSEYILPDENLIGLSIVYKLYKFILNKIDFIMTNKNNTPDAKNLWYNLLKDKDIYTGTNKMYNILIKKNISDTDLKAIIDKVKKYKLIYDDQLDEKIKEFYD